MRCADISADRDTDGQWIIAKAVFSGSVDGTVKLVRTNNILLQDKLFVTKCQILSYEV